MPGAQEQRLIRALTGADGGRVFGQGGQWSDCANLITVVADRLEVTELPIHGGEAGTLTADAMKSAFTKAAAALRKRNEHLGRGQQALVDAADALERARAEYDRLGPEGSAPSYTPHEDPGSEAGIKHRNAFLDELAVFNSQQQHREDVSRAQADQLDDVLEKSAGVMQTIHGQTDDDIGDPGGSGGYPAGRATGGGGGVASGGGGPTGVLTAGPHPTYDEGPRGSREPGGPRVDYVHGHPTANPGGTLIPAAEIPGVSTGSSTGGGGLGLSPAGLAAGGAAAGIIGAKLGGALRGALAGGGAGATGSVVAGRGTAASAVRGIGASARAAGATTLGRGAAAGGGTPGRPGSAAGPGAGGGTPGRSRAGTGAARAGGRAGAALGAGRGSRRGEAARAGDHETFEVGEDWVGDDDAAPGVLT